MVKAREFHSIKSVILDPVRNRFSELSICGSGGSSNVGIGRFNKVGNIFEVLNDMGEKVEEVNTFEEALKALKVKNYIEFNISIDSFLAWHKKNPEDYYSSDKTMYVALNDFLRSDYNSVSVNKNDENNNIFKLGINNKGAEC